MASDLTIWRWLLFCDGSNDCERACGGLGESEPKLGRINLSLQTRDMAIAAYHEHCTSGMEIALKVLFPYNNADEINLRYVHKSGKDFPWTILDQLLTLELKIQGKVLYYQCHDYGQFCFEIDGKYDLNNEGAPVLSIVIKDQAGYDSPLAFSFSNKENYYTIWLAVQAVKANIPCNNPHYKHQLTKLALQNLVHGQNKSDNKAAEMGNEYKKFIYFLPLDDNVKNLLIRDLEMNWICDKWRQGFIDGGRELQIRTQTVLSFIECLYDVKFIKKSLVQSELGETLSNADLATYWNMRMIEHKQMPFKKPIDQKHHINQGHLYALLDFIIPIPEQTNYMFVKKQSTIFCSSYNNHYINISTEVSEQINKMIIKLINCDNINIPASHYLINISTNECTCYDYVWNRSFRDALKHFKNKKKAIASENKNYLIYNGSSKQAYQEILQLFNAVGDDIFFLNECQTTMKDPFHSINNISILTMVRASKIHKAKYRKPSQFSNLVKKSLNNKLPKNHLNNLDQDYTCDTENINAYDDEYDDSFAEFVKYA
ncbi:6602_t:CDS:2 [Cetraspora pellucida]|uniref:6602_t:CDS:1 n=1 Tax=Cetraspora pellucida TaxID=1433469 RepID=A0A9N9HUY3_9GLOM|nr:6602_t:CDS:2 [Cetraspora pellucida]